MSDVEKLKNINLLSLLSDGEVGCFAEACEEIVVSQGDVVFHENDPGDSLFLVASGRVQITQRIVENQEEHLPLVFEGDVFGEMTFIDGTSRSSTATALDDCLLFMIKRESFDRLLLERPELTFKIMQQMNRILTARLRATNEKVRESLEWNLQISGASALSMQHLISSNAAIEMELSNKTKISGHILLVVATDLGYQVTVKDDIGRLYIIPYSAVNYISVQETDFRKSIENTNEKRP